QSFAVLLSLSQLQPWRQIAKRSSTAISYEELEFSGAASESKHTNLFKWSKRWGRAPAFTGIARCDSDDWSVELAILDVGPILATPYDGLSPKQRHLRDALYRNAIHRFGANLKRHVPGYRTGMTVPGAPPADSTRTVASFMKEIHLGQQPHHTCCF